MKFWDASAILPLLVEEADSLLREHQLAERADMMTWWATRVECASALTRLEREGKLDADAVETAYRKLSILANAWTEVQATPSVQARAMRLLRVHPLRAAEALQLAAALVAVADVTNGCPFLCSDQRLATAARKEGFSTPAA